MLSDSGGSEGFKTERASEPLDGNSWKDGRNRGRLTWHGGLGSERHLYSGLAVPGSPDF